MDLSGAFDPSSMQYLTTQLAHPGVQDPFQDMIMPHDFQDHHSAYGYAGSDDVNLHGLHHAPLKHFSSTYEDPFSDIASAFENPVSNVPDQEPETSIDRDNKLLSFSPANFPFTLLDYMNRRVTISLRAQLHGMFFLAESPWTQAGDAPQPPPSELTCYRRNLFQISGEVILPCALRCIITENGQQINITGQELIVCATESTEDNPVKIIAVPWKTPANPAAAQMPAPPEDKTEREPSSHALDLNNMQVHQDMNSEYASFPFQWKRLQFRIATANNGRRKELQQHFVVKLKVMAVLENGARVSLCEAYSQPVIVRGRSPRNFQSRKDMPLNGAGHVRKAGSQRPGSGDSTKVKAEGPTSAPVKIENNTNANQSVASFFDTHEDAAAFDWNNATSTGAHHGAMTAIPQPLASPTEPQGRNIYPSSSPDMTRHNQNNNFRSTSATPQAFNRNKQQRQQVMVGSQPISLSLVEDDSPSSLAAGASNTTTPEATGRPPKRLQIPARAPSFTINTLNSPDESADLLYEYFPLGLDDWMPPVDAVYRPHVVHHTKLPTDPRDPARGGGSGKSGKRSMRLYVGDED